jgi:hypothetical protein
LPFYFLLLLFTPLERLNLAKNRYGWQKRAKEMARKDKNDAKMKRRQSKTITPPAEDLPEVVMDP